ncbi:calcium-dependent phosphotriesterase [Zopfia rhizophila CBS 207.26]|uniref:Calcium-dependent phosphotriesterase n=1 Tax=Zopfia rhizophila CBS 207.26 TaxID=1314779 RepID=A0A6A6EQG6_9PEZI|nr:calcium-dependent phosphotriesterase [Zopfia rhizophila CBS 207.26]
MTRGILIFVSALVVLFASIYQLVLKELISVTFGVGRVIQPIEDFPYKCRRLEHERLQACEDIWLDDEARVLYAACTGTRHRMEWNQAMGKLNVSGRRPGGSELIALDIDSPGKDGLFGMRGIKPVGYDGAAGDGALDLVGFDAEVIDLSNIHFYLVNQRPPVDAERKYTDPTKTGANATIDVFQLKRGENKIRHIRTVVSPEVWSPNRVAILSKGSFVVSNDHSTKVGLRKEFDTILGGGNIAYCSPSGNCHGATITKFKFPNGLTKGKDGLIYVPSSVDGTIRVFELQSDKMLKEIDIIKTTVPLDNVATDAKGDLYAAGFPNLFQAMGAIEKPFENTSPSTIFRIRKTKAGYQVDKVLEDRDSKVLSGVTTARHDVKTGRLFLGAALTPYMMVCDPK